MPPLVQLAVGDDRRHLALTEEAVWLKPSSLELDSWGKAPHCHSLAKWSGKCWLPNPSGLQSVCLYDDVKAFPHRAVEG